MDELLEQFYASNLDGSSVDEDQPIELEADNSMGNAFSGGLIAGTEGMGASIDYFQALLGTAVGADEFAERNIAEADFANATGRAALAGVEEFGEFLEEPTVGGAFTQIAKAGGQGLPSLLYSIGTLATGGVLGAAGGALARTSSKKAAKRLVDDATKKVLDGTATPRDLELAQAAYDLTKKVATRNGAKFGSYAGLAAGEYPSLAGENFSEALGAGQNRDLETALQSALVAVPQAAIGVGTEVAFLKLLGKSAASRSTGEGSVFGQLASNIGQKAGRGAGLEGLSEYAQTEIAIQNRLSYDPDYSQEERNLRRMESFFAGAVVGGFAGGAGGAVSTLYQNRGAAAEKAAPIFEKSRKLWEDAVERRQNDKIDEEEAQGAQAPQSEFAEGQVVTLIAGKFGPTSAAQANDGSILTEREITPEEVTIVKIKKADNGETIYQGKTKDGETKMWSDKELATGRWVVNPSREQMEALQKERADLLAKQQANKKTSGEIETEDLAERRREEGEDQRFADEVRARMQNEERSDDLFAPENLQPERTPEEKAAWEADRAEKAAAYRKKLEDAEFQRKETLRRKRQAQAKKNFSADPEDGLLAAIVAAGGISRSSVERDGAQITEAFKTARVKGRSVFRKEGGLDIDQMLTALRELGYYNDAPQGRPDDIGVNDLLEDLDNALADPDTPYFTNVKGPSEQSLEDAYNEYYGNEQDDTPDLLTDDLISSIRSGYDMDIKDVAEVGDGVQSPWLTASGKIVGTNQDHIAFASDAMGVLVNRNEADASLWGDDFSYSDFMRATGAIRFGAFKDANNGYVVSLHVAVGQNLTSAQMETLRYLNDQNGGNVKMLYGEADGMVNPEYSETTVSEFLSEQDDEPTQRSMQTGRGLGYETFTPTADKPVADVNAPPLIPRERVGKIEPTREKTFPQPRTKKTEPRDLETRREAFRTTVGENLATLVAEDPDNARLVALEKQYREGDNARKDEILGVLYAEKQELARTDTRDEEATMEEVQDYFQGQGFQENVETIETKGYSRKKDPKKTFKNTEASRAQFEEAFGKKDWSDPFYAHMTESFLRRAAEAKMADVTPEGDPQSDFKIVATEKGYVLEKTSFIKDPDALDDQFVLKTLRGAKRSQFASGSGVELIEAGLEPKEINLVNLTDAGRELVRQRGNNTYQGDALAEIARQALPEFITEITELNVKLADEGKPTFDIRIQGKSIFDITSQDLLGPIGDVVAARADGADVQLRDVLGARGQMGDSRVETTVEQAASGARVRNTVVTDRKSDNFVSIEFTDSFGEQSSIRRENNRPDGELLTLETAKKEMARLERDGFKQQVGATQDGSFQLQNGYFRLRLSPKGAAYKVTGTRRVKQPTTKTGRIITGRLSPSRLKKMPNKLVVFGDNLLGTGKGGQAIIRDEPNAFGIPTKRAPRRTEDAYFSDKPDEIKAVNEALDKLRGKEFFLPEAGVGTGLAQLQERSPQIAKILNDFFSAEVLGFGEVQTATVNEADPRPSELGSNLAGAPQPASQARVEQIITAKQTQTTRGKGVDEATAREQFSNVQDVEEYFYSPEQADAYADKLRNEYGFDDVTVSDPVVNEGADRDTEQGLGDEVMGMSTANYNRDGLDAPDPNLPKTRLNLEMNPRRDIDRSSGGKNGQPYGRQTYRGAEYPFGSLGTISTEFVTKTIAKIKPKKPVIVIGLSQLRKLNPAKIAEQFNDQQVANMVISVAAELASNNAKRGEYIGFTNAHVALVDDISVANDLQTALISAHEALGHVLFNEEIEGTLTNPVLRKRLERDFERARSAPGAPEQYQTEHGFEEWFADQTAITAKNIYIKGQKPPSGVVGKTFAKVVETLKSMWNALSTEFKRRFGKDSYSQNFDDYIENTIIKQRAHLQQAAGKATREVSYKKKSLIRAMEESITKNPDAQRSVNSMLRNFKDHIDGTAVGHTMFKAILPEDNILRGISPLIADMMYARPNAKSRAGNQFGYLKSKDHVRGQVYDQLEQMLGTNWETKEVQDAFELAADQDKKTEDLDGKAREIRDWLNKFYDDYIAKTPGNEIAKRDDYFPVALDLAAIFNNETRRMFVDATDTTHQYSEMSMPPEAGFLKDGVDPNGFIDIQDLKTIKELTDEEIDSFLKQDFRTEKPFEEMTRVEKGVMTELRMRERLRLASPEITFTELVIKYNPLADEQSIRRTVSGLVARQQHIVADDEITFDATNPQSVVEKARVLTENIPHNELKPFIEKPEVALMKYVRHVITRSEWKRNTHDADGRDMLAPELDKLPEAKRKEAVATLERYLGYTDKPLNPRLSKAMSWMQLFNWVTLLPLATIGSIPEFGGAIVNTKEFNGFGMAKNAILSRIQNPEQAIQLARTLGVTHSTVMGNLGLTEADAEYLDPRVRKYSDAFFSKIGLDYFTRYTREFASVMSVEFLTTHANPETQIDRSERYLKDHGVTAEQVKSWHNRQVDGAHYTFEGEDGKAVMGAMQRFVDNSMLKPNAAERTSWGNDPRYQLIWSLKAYLMSFGKVILGGIKREMQMRLAEGDTTLAKLSSVGMMGLLTAAAFMPLAALSLELRELAKAMIAGVLPGVDVNARYFRSDRMDVMTYLGELFDRGGLAGPMAIFGMVGKSAEWGESQGLGPIGVGLKALSPIFGPTYGLLVDDIGLGLYGGKGWDVVPARIIPGYSLVL